MNNYASETVVEPAVVERQLNYSAYAPQFDGMCELIPVYQENIDALLSFIATQTLPENPRILDLGAGTGNFIVAMSEILPSAEFVHLDADSEMNRIARDKYADAGISMIEIHQQFMQRASFPDDEFDLILCVNALNTAPPQSLMLMRIRKWLKPNGKLYLIDFGRKQKTMDWTWYLFSNTVKRYGVWRFFYSLYKNREAIKQNRRASNDQDNGLMWLHTPEQFKAALEEAGFNIEVFKTCYREYCDLAICSNPP